MCQEPIAYREELKQESYELGFQTLDAANKASEVHEELGNAVDDIFKEKYSLIERIIEEDDSRVARSQALAEQAAKFCIGPLSTKRFILFGRPVVRCSSLLVLGRRED
jgi:hypothetical protein